MGLKIFEEIDFIVEIDCLILNEWLRWPLPLESNRTMNKSFIVYTSFEYRGKFIGLQGKSGWKQSTVK